MHYTERLGQRCMEKLRCMGLAQSHSISNVYLQEGKGNSSAAVREQVY